jgi:hypothetical protein
MNEDILAAALGLDEAITFGRVEPLHSACSHNKSPSRYKRRPASECQTDIRSGRVSLSYIIAVMPAELGYNRGIRFILPLRKGGFS